LYYIGYDIGSSSIKAALVDGDTNQPVSVVSHPDTEMPIDSPHKGWAEQNPECWWEHVVAATRKLLADQPKAVRDGVAGVGISYQMHGLVLVGNDHKALRPSIIWCDSRAVEPGNEALNHLGASACYTHLLNAPGNFTASKLKWVRDHEPEVYNKIHKMMLPGDFLALRMTGECTTTPSGLSEGIMWDFKEDAPAEFAFDEFGIKEEFIPNIRPTFSSQGQLMASAAEALGVPAGIPVAYRAGDQPNNAMSLGALNPGEIAATGGTSGVVYGIVDRLVFDPKSRVNSFAHVNHTKADPRIGVLLCINGAGSQYRWVRQHVAASGSSYGEMEEQMRSVPMNSDGLRVLPFGNGAERILDNQDVGSHFINLQFNRHSKAHVYRAALEGIAFSFAFGMDILKELGLEVNKIRVGNDNLFQSGVFANTVATLLSTEIELVETTGAVGAAKAVGYTLGHKATLEQAMSGLSIEKTVRPLNVNGQLEHGYQTWKEDLMRLVTA